MTIRLLFHFAFFFLTAFQCRFFDPPHISPNETKAVFFTKENIQEVIKLYGTQNNAMDKLDLQLKDARPNPGSARIVVSSFSDTTKQIIHTVTLGTEECSGKKITSTFYNNGEVFYQELGELRTFFGEFKTDSADISPGKSSAGIKTRFGVPWQSFHDVIRYQTDVDGAAAGGTVSFYFSNDRLFGIRIARPVLCKN